VLDLVAGPESRGNYNAWYRAAHQSDLQLAELTVAEVRTLPRRLHWELHGRAAPCGQIPALGGAAIQTRTQQVHAGPFAALYERRAGAAMLRQLDIRAVMAAHDLYRLLRMPEAQLDFNGAWVIARDLRVGTAELSSCQSCQVHYLVSSSSRLAPTCPFCALHAWRAGRAEPRLILPAGIVEFPDDRDRAILLTPSEEDP
jgi:hypothetical protein